MKTIQLDIHNLRIGDSNIVHASLNGQPICGAGKHATQPIVKVHDQPYNCQRCTPCVALIHHANHARAGGLRTAWSIGFHNGYLGNTTPCPYHQKREGSKYQSWQRGWLAGRNRRITENQAAEGHSSAKGLLQEDTLLVAQAKGTTAAINGAGEGNNPYEKDTHQFSYWLLGHAQPSTKTYKVRAL